jgi:hypothetical protein
VLSFENVEEVCESKRITLVVHPAIRRAVKGYEESFYIGLLRFSQRRSSGGHPILRVDPVSPEGLQRIKTAQA